MARVFRVGSGLVLCVAAAVVLSARADPISISNYSFESPRVAGNPYGLPVVLNPTSWHTSGPGQQVTFDGVNYYNPNTGIFANAKASGGTYFSNADDGTGNGSANQAGAQLAYIFSDTGEEFQQTLSTNYQAGEAYALTVAAANAGSAPPPTDQLLVSLFYTDPGADPTVAANRHFLTTTSVLSSSLPNSSDTAAVALADITAQSGLVGAGDAAVGQPINVLISVNGAGGGEFDFDNVRLTSGIPEPAGLGLVAASAAALLRRRRR